eukprot:scaffold834_cov123-Cylindrotheca_fusiformis.AAC.9
MRVPKETVGSICMSSDDMNVETSQLDATMWDFSLDITRRFGEIFHTRSFDLLLEVAVVKLLQTRTDENIKMGRQTCYVSDRPLSSAISHRNYEVAHQVRVTSSSSLGTGANIGPGKRKATYENGNMFVPP